MRAFFPLVQLLLVTIVVFWNVLLAGRIAQVRSLPRPFVFVTALAGFLLIPALMIHLANTSAITGRSVTAVDWIWPLTVVLFAIQAVYAAVRRLVYPFLGFFLSVYDVMIAIDAVLRYVALHGRTLPTAALVFLAATSGAFAWVMQSPVIIASPFFFFIPMTAPSFPAMRRSATTFRFALGVVAFIWIGIVGSGVLSAIEAVSSYDAHDPRREKLQERPANDLDIGIKLFPDLEGVPPPVAITNDLALADTLGVSVVSVTIVPERMNLTALDSLAHTLEALRSDSTQLVLTLGYESSLLPGRTRDFSEKKRLDAIEPIVRILKPDILLPAQDPYDAGLRAAGPRSPQFWQDYLTRASDVAKRTRPRVRIGVAASAFDTRDSILYAWAAAAGSPIDVMGFTLYPSPAGVTPLDAARGAADRWMRESRSTKDHWVFAVGGFPVAHGEASQESAVWSALAWATSRPMIKGFIVAESGDYGTIRGIRAADGHLRRVAFAIMRAMAGLRETAAPDSAPALLKGQQRVGG
ncbi:MAG: hypothetical protein JWM95_2921 [Gemmatimonadetes bacterium]|nr:hypothetical protein [Gemmatimonadota bacterium]